MQHSPFAPQRSRPPLEPRREVLFHQPPSPASGASATSSSATNTTATTTPTTTRNQASGSGRGKNKGGRGGREGQRRGVRPQVRALQGGQETQQTGSGRVAAARRRWSGRVQWLEQRGGKPGARRQGGLLLFYCSFYEL